MSTWKIFALGALAGAFVIIWLHLGVVFYAKESGRVSCSDGTIRAAKPPIEVRH